MAEDINSLLWAPYYTDQSNAKPEEFLVTRNPNSDLDKNAFLQLLITQMRYQDPLNPVDDKEFLAQMAQFTALEQMTQLNKTMEGMANLNQYSAVNYVGSTVLFDYEAEDGTIKPVMGTVVAVWYDSKDGPILEVDGYGELPLKKIDGVTLV